MLTYNFQVLCRFSQDINSNKTLLIIYHRPEPVIANLLPYPLFWAALELREDIDTVLEPGMVVSMEPIPEGQPGAGGYRELNVLVITEDGTVDNITGFPFWPEHNIFKK